VTGSPSTPAAGIGRSPLTSGESGSYIEMSVPPRRRRDVVARSSRPPLAALALVALMLTPAATGRTHADPPAAKPASAASPGPPGYVIGLADVLRVVVWKEPDLTVDVTVRPDGMITVPLLGDVLAAGRVPSQLAATLVDEFQRFIEAPRVTVSVTQATSARIYVVGQMMRPGEFPLSGRLTVLKALALAGGFKEFARPEGIVIIREDQTVLPFNYKRVADGKDVSQNVVLAAGDTIVVP
jgi:polysaccharide export outer membrane protein